MTVICCKHFVGLGVPVLGIEPAANVAETARQAGVPTLNAFFGPETATQVVAERGHADLIVANNVLAQVPELNDFVAGMAHLLAPEGVVTIEVPHLERLMDENQFDTIYHEHFSYFSLGTMSRLAAAHGLALIDVETLPTHGGSLRVYLAHRASRHPVSIRVADMLAQERRAGLEMLVDLFQFRRPRSAHQARASFRPHQGQGRGKAHLRLWRAGKGQHAPQLRRHRHRFLGLHRRSQSLQARPLHAGHAHPDPSRWRRSTTPSPITF